MEIEMNEIEIIEKKISFRIFCGFGLLIVLLIVNNK